MRAAPTKENLETVLRSVNIPIQQREFLVNPRSEEYGLTDFNSAVDRIVHSMEIGERVAIYCLKINGLGKVDQAHEELAGRIVDELLRLRVGSNTAPFYFRRDRDLSDGGVIKDPKFAFILPATDVEKLYEQILESVKKVTGEMFTPTLATVVYTAKKPLHPVGHFMLNAELNKLLESSEQRSKIKYL